VRFVKNLTKLTGRQEILSALTTANRNIEGSLVSMTLSVSAVYASLRSKLIDTQRKRPVQDHATVRCTGVSHLANRKDVYCLEVPSNNLFAVGSGVLVHNCLDSLRYLVNSGINLAAYDGGKEADPYRSRLGKTIGSWMGQ
jgi:hypothetical protein